MIYVIFWDHSENYEMQRAKLESVPRTGDLVQLRDGLTYEVGAVGWDLSNGVKAENPDVYVNLVRTAKEI